MSSQVNEIVDRYDGDATRLMDMLWAIQHQFGYLSDECIEALAKALHKPALDIRETASFYHFFRAKPFGRHAIYLCDSVIGRLSGLQSIRQTLEAETGARFGSAGATEAFGLDETACIGLSDQEPAMMVDDVVFTRLTAEKTARIIAELKAGRSAREIANPEGHASRSLAYVDAIVESNIHRKGPVFFQEGLDYKAILAGCLSLSADEVIVRMTESNIRGRGGAGFPAGLKWRFARDAAGAQKYILCNADEGEPGTFKDRVLLTRSPLDVLIGMVIAGHAVGSQQGIVYLRAEYWYLKDYLEGQIEDLHAAGLLGSNILGSGHDFTIRIQMGAGAYVCGDETALIDSCEGKRGTPRVKPPFPIQQGYLGMPTVVNNVETFASVTRIMEKGSRWFAALGTAQSSGTRLLSVSGDCARPGIYEVEWGISLNEVLALVGADSARAVQISGPSGECVSVAEDGHRKLCYSDLSCNGSFMIFNEQRDLLDIVRQFTQFFVAESCGICTPCRTGGVAMLGKIDRIMAGRGCQQDLEECQSLGRLMHATSRCGLGTTAGKPLLTTLRKFPELFEQKLSDDTGLLRPSFDAEAAVSDYNIIVRSLQGGASA